MGLRLEDWDWDWDWQQDWGMDGMVKELFEMMWDQRQGVCFRVVTDAARLVLVDPSTAQVSRRCRC